MRGKIWIYPLLLMGLILLFTFGCEDENNPDNQPTTVTDIDGNVYNTVTIGTQVWMKENLKVTRYRNGEAIPLVTDSIAWSCLSTSAYCSYDNSTTQSNIYGYLYNWYAVNDSRNIAPEGWHVPSDYEWTQLIDYLGGTTVAGGKMKVTGLTYWAAPNTGATNESNFSALPGGYRYPADGVFYLIGKGGYWWSNTVGPDIISNAWMSSAIYNNTHAPLYYYDKRHGYSVRCVKD
ncbi:MAG: fibrobacter succinogenes major paralogous domain-containing protein [Ignavibacteriales bacterium]|nr:fibrobacter succinogenes major paralogous domain-containing protein [Ignavibacteriales bacterium]